MAKVSKAYPTDRISKTRLTNTILLTALSLIFAAVICFHLYWAINLIRYRVYGHLINNLVFGMGTFVANAGLTAKALVWLNERLLDSRIDEDHKKYI